jgi:hypothetical protein
MPAAAVISAPHRGPLEATSESWGVVTTSWRAEPADRPLPSIRKSLSHGHQRFMGPESYGTVAQVGAETLYPMMRAASVILSS